MTDQTCAVPDLDPSVLAVLDGVPTAIFVHDAAGRPYFANEQAWRLLGAVDPPAGSLDELAAAAQIYVADTDTRYPLEHLPMIGPVRGGDSRLDNMEIRRPDGTVHLEVWMKATTTPDGRPLSIIHSFIDATERKNAQADDRLTESLAKTITSEPGFADVLETSLHEICQLTGWTYGQAWLPDASGRRLRCLYAWHDGSVQFASIHQVCRRLVVPFGAGLPGRVWESKQWEWTDDNGVDVVANAGARPLAAIPPHHRAGVAIPVLVDGEVVAVLEFFVLVGGNQDQRSVDRVAAVVSRVGRWMTSKGAEDAGRRDDGKFRQIAETTADAILFASPDSTAIYLNPAAEKLLGYSADEVARRLLAQLIRDRAQDRAGERDRERMIRPPVYLSAVRKNGQVLPVEVTLTSRPQGGGTSFTAIVRDSSDRVQTERRLRDALGVERKAREELQALDAMKYTVLQAVAHDLRSPMAAVLILTEILRADAGAELSSASNQLSAQSRTTFLSDIELSVGKMGRLLEDLLDCDPVRGIEARRHPCDAGQLVRRVLAENDLRSLHPVNTQLESVLIHADSAQVERIVDNLLNNALKHLAPGVPVWVSAVAFETGVLISVEDAGTGVRPEMRTAIFEPFRRGDTQPSKGPSLGLGLSLVRRFAEAHGGRAWVQDRPGGGASFRVYLPDAEVTVPAPARCHSPVRVASRRSHPGRIR